MSEDIPDTLHPMFAQHPASVAYRITLSAHEHTWTQEEQEAMARALVQLDRRRNEAKSARARPVDIHAQPHELHEPREQCIQELITAANEAAARADQLHGEVLRLRDELTRLRERVGPIDPGGGDRIDELESAVAFLKTRAEAAERTLEAERITAGQIKTQRDQLLCAQGNAAENAAIVDWLETHGPQAYETGAQWAARHNLKGLTLREAMRSVLGYQAPTAQSDEVVSLDFRELQQKFSEYVTMYEKALVDLDAERKRASHFETLYLQSVERRRALNTMLRNLEEPVAAIAKLGRCPQGGEQVGNQIHFMQLGQELKNLLDNPRDVPAVECDFAGAIKWLEQNASVITYRTSVIWSAYQRLHGKSLAAVVENLQKKVTNAPADSHH